MNIYQTKKYCNRNENMLFLRKTDKIIWKLPLSKRTPLSTNPLFLSNFFITLLFVQISTTRLPPNFRGRKLCIDCL